MRSGEEILRARAAAAGVTLEDRISGDVFERLGLPMIVACRACRTTMVLLNCWVDGFGNVYCGDCAGEREGLDAPAAPGAPGE